MIFEIEQIHHFHQLYWQTIKQPQQKGKRGIVVRIYVSKTFVCFIYIFGKLLMKTFILQTVFPQIEQK